MELSVGDEADVSELAEALVRLGYCRAETVEGVGQFAFRGGIFDVFPPSLSRPVRIEFFGDEIDAIGAFDITTQRRTENLRRVRVTPALELPPDLAGGGREAFADRVGGLLKGLNLSLIHILMCIRDSGYTALLPGFPAGKPICSYEDVYKRQA